MSTQIMKQSNSQSYTKRNSNMKRKLTCSKVLSLGVISLLSLTSLSLFSADYSRTEKELKIMSKIFDTSLSEAKLSNRRFPGSERNTEAIYLAKQGMVFSFNFNQSRFGSGEEWAEFGEGIGQLVGSISAEIAQSFSDIEITPDVPRAPRVPRVAADWEDNVEAYEEYQELMENLRDEQRDQREQVRDLQRSIRDTERQARRQQEVDSKQLKETKTRLKEKMKVLEKKIKIYSDTREKYEEERRAKYRVNTKKKSDLITSTLCDYGSTLRSLKSNEHVTLIFKNYENDKDQVYVFNYNDVKSCSSKDKLLKKAVSYQL